MWKRGSRCNFNRKNEEFEGPRRRDTLLLLLLFSSCLEQKAVKCCKYVMIKVLRDLER
jgi:hypothetical protein